MHLWPYTLRYTTYTRNYLLDKPDGSLLIERFIGVKVVLLLINIHAFACPVYVLDNKLQAKKSIPR